MIFDKKGEFEDVVQFHYTLLDAHLTYIWQGSFKHGRYHITKAKRCDNKKVSCDTKIFPSTWNLSNKDSKFATDQLKMFSSNKVSMRN